MPRERRRSFSVERKLAIVEETRAAGATVPQVARRHDVSANLVYVWRRMAEGRAARAVGLVPVMIEEPAKAAGRSLGPGWIEIVLPGGVCVKVEGEVDPVGLGAVLALLRGPVGRNLGEGG